VVLTAGKLPWTDLDIRPGAPQCAVSPRVYEQFGIDQQEPPVIDLRPYRSAADGLNTTKPGYDNAIATLAASILRRDKDTLFGEHITRQRRIRMYVGVAAVVFLALGLFRITQTDLRGTNVSTPGLIYSGHSSRSCKIQIQLLCTFIAYNKLL